MPEVPPPAEIDVASARPGVLAAFAFPTFRRLWLADVFSTWGAEMEVIILGWYVLVHTDSAFLVSVIGALRFGGTLLAPAAGVVADRVSRRTLLIGLRVGYVLLSGSLALVALTDSLPVALVFLVAGVAGLLRPTEQILRQSLIADVVPRALLTNALGFGRTTMESARVAGPLAGAGLMSTLGVGPAFLGVTGMYLLSVAASLFIRLPAPTARTTMSQPFSELREGVRYIRGVPVIVVCLALAFLVNFTAFPLTLGLLPVVARDVFAADANGLARMAAAVAVGALAGSVLVAVATRNLAPQRMMFTGLIAWHLLIIMFAATDDLAVAYGLLVLNGLAASTGMIPIAVVLLTHADPGYRGRVMGVRMLAVYGLPLGLLVAGALMEWIGIAPTIVLYGILGLVPILAVAACWRRLVPAPG